MIAPLRSVAKRPAPHTAENSNVVQLTHGPEHHFFGFHDLSISSRKSGSAVVLAVHSIDRPPLGDVYAEVKVLQPDSYPEMHPVSLARTNAFNFPQGARQQWLGDTDLVIVNEISSSGVAAMGIFDGIKGHRVGQIEGSCYCVDDAGKNAYSIDFGRLHRLGGYGYAAIADQTPDISEPTNNGIFVTDIKNGQSRLLKSIAEVAAISRKDQKGEIHHFITHLRLNPSNSRMAFLHRYRLADGGEETRLMTMALDGTDTRLLGQGFLSHFDWIDDNRIMIWGRKNHLASDLRNSTLLQSSLVRAVLPIIKVPLKRLFGRSAGGAMSFLVFTDGDDAQPAVIGEQVLTVDGHPMLNSVYGDWLVNDTYPDDSGDRELMLFKISTGERIDLGRFRMLDETPSPETISLVRAHLRQRLTVDFPAELYAFTRSGLHCDLHPRWFADGRRVAFDSIHQGQRQVYSIGVEEVVN